MSDDRATRVLACLENAQAAVQSALEGISGGTITWGDSEEAATDVAYGHIEQIRRLLDAIELSAIREAAGELAATQRGASAES